MLFSEEFILPQIKGEYTSLYKTVICPMICIYYYLSVDKNLWDFSLRIKMVRNNLRVPRHLKNTSSALSIYLKRSANNLKLRFLSASHKCDVSSCQKHGAPAKNLEFLTAFASHSQLPPCIVHTQRIKLAGIGWIGIGCQYSWVHLWLLIAQITSFCSGRFLKWM